MGVKKWSLIRHYLIIPVIISLTGGTIGTVIGLSPLGVGLLSESTESFYSLPEFVSHIDYRIVAMGVLAPVLISAVVTVIIANKKLSNSPLSILRHEKKYVRSRQEILILCRLLLHSEYRHRRSRKI